jgi:hypothetical protein
MQCLTKDKLTSEIQMTNKTHNKHMAAINNFSNTAHKISIQTTPIKVKVKQAFENLPTD